MSTRTVNFSDQVALTWSYRHSQSRVCYQLKQSTRTNSQNKFQFSNNARPATGDAGVGTVDDQSGQGGTQKSPFYIATSYISLAHRTSYNPVKPNRSIVNLLSSI